MREMLDRMEAAGKLRMPPALYVHMPLDASMAAKVADNLAALRDQRVSAAEVKVGRRCRSQGGARAAARQRRPSLVLTLRCACAWPPL
jgi:hypothetical protein